MLPDILELETAAQPGPGKDPASKSTPHAVGRRVRYGQGTGKGRAHLPDPIPVLSEQGTTTQVAWKRDLLSPSSGFLECVRTSLPLVTCRGSAPVSLQLPGFLVRAVVSGVWSSSGVVLCLRLPCHKA